MFYCPYRYSSCGNYVNSWWRPEIYYRIYIISNLGTAIIAPLLFSFGLGNEDVSFISTFTDIFLKVFPLLFAPLILAWIIRFTMPPIQNFMLRFSKAPFYLWSFALTLATATTVSYLVKIENHNITLELSLAVISLIICSFQFVVGKTLGSKYNNRIAAGQSLGQKNTILAIWMAQTFLNPITTLAPATYILWQNIINSYQLWKREKNLSKQSIQKEEPSH